jgi:hypothetical protein
MYKLCDEEGYTYRFAWGNIKNLPTKTWQPTHATRDPLSHNTQYTDHLSTRVSHVEEANQQHWLTSSAERMICHMFSLRKK